MKYFSNKKLKETVHVTVITYSNSKPPNKPFLMSLFLGNEILCAAAF